MLLKNYSPNVTNYFCHIFKKGKYSNKLIQNWCKMTENHNHPSLAIKFWKIITASSKSICSKMWCRKFFAETKSFYYQRQQLVVKIDGNKPCR